MASDDTGEIRLINHAAMQLLGLKKLAKLEELCGFHPGFREILSRDPEKNHQQVKILVNGKLIQLAVKSSMVRMQGQAVNIFFLSDISREMAWNEVEAWQKLIRVLNHEITNSVSPIQILSASLYDLFHQGNKNRSPREIDEKLIDKTVLGLKTIRKRSGGLADFIKDFHNFIHTGVPDYTTVKVRELLQGVEALMLKELSDSGAKLTVEATPPDLVILADEKLVEQALINLVRNALQATIETRKPIIHLRGYREGDHAFLEVSDNGKGIPGHIIEHVFTPFFTTRKEGSGIGLSMARQVMQMHHGSITVSSEEGRKTTFTMAF